MLQKMIKKLTDAGIEHNEAKIELEMLFEHFANYSTKDFVLGTPISSEKLAIVEEKVNLRAETRMPIQHIIGFAKFMGEDFIVNPSVLIPRDETEILVRQAIDIINKNKFNSALDVGTGTGCIACMIAKHTDCRIIGLDISNEALHTAINNATRLNLFNKAIFRKSDIFSKIRDYEKFDLIVSNPPYIPLSEKPKIQKEVTFDPDLALYTSDEKGLEFYEKITLGAKKVLNPNGYLLFEVGINQADDIADIMRSNNFENIEIIQDLANIDRVVMGRLNKGI